MIYMISTLVLISLICPKRHSPLKSECDSQARWDDDCSQQNHEVLILLQFLRHSCSIPSDLFNPFVCPHSLFLFVFCVCVCMHTLVVVLSFCLQ